MMPSFRVVLVEPEYEINIGYCARVMKNFGFDELVLVHPKTKIDFDAMMYSKHAHDILRSARIAKNFRDAVKGCDFIVGTTGILRRGRTTLRNPISPKEFAARARRSNAKFALVFGREGTGLNKKEIGACDFLITIPASERYPVLNISHALAIILYELFSSNSKKQKIKMLRRASAREKEMLLKTFNGITDVFAPHLRNAHKVKLAFKRVVGRALISDIEASSIICVLMRAADKLIRNKTKK
ncbi:MAG: RNA methyltransferase [Candidatus Micrarchaeota archaeon]